MRNALSITFKNTMHTEHLEKFIENRFLRLKKMVPDVIQCSVTVRTPNQSRRNGVAKQVTITAQMPGKTLTAKRRCVPADGIDLYSAISNAFHAIETQAESRTTGRMNYKNFRKLSYLDSHQYAG